MRHYYAKTTAVADAMRERDALWLARRFQCKLWSSDMIVRDGGARNTH